MSRGIYDRTFRRKVLPVSIEILEKEYADGMSLNKLSKKYNVGVRCIRDRMVERGFKLRGFGIPSGSPDVWRTGNFDKYPVEAYRNPPCGSEMPVCIILRDFFRRMDKVPMLSVDISDRLTELWNCVRFGDERD